MRARVCFVWNESAEEEKRLSGSEKEKEKETKGTQQIIQQRKHMRYERSAQVRRNAILFSNAISCVRARASMAF